MLVMLGIKVLFMLLIYNIVFNVQNTILLHKQWFS